MKAKRTAGRKKLKANRDLKRVKSLTTLAPVPPPKNMMPR